MKEILIMISNYASMSLKIYLNALSAIKKNKVCVCIIYIYMYVA